MSIYIYIYNCPYGKKKTRQVIWRWKCTTNHCQGEKIYIGKKEKTNLVIPIEKKSKDTQLIGQNEKKNTFRAAKLQ